jgi:hypothetical protein
MHRAIAAWLTEHPWRPIVTIALCGALAQGLLPFMVLACAIPVLTALRFDAKLGLAAAAVGAGVQCGIVLSLAPAVLVGTYPGIALMYFSPVALAMLLKRTGSLNLCFQIAVLAVAVALCVVDIVLADPVGAWKAPLTQLLDLLAPELTQVDRDAIVAVWAPPMWGGLGACALAMVFGVLLLGRWWDSLLGTQAGAFGAEYQRLRLGVALGVGVTAVFVLAMVTGFVLVSWLTSVALTALTFQGLAAAHRSRAGGRFKLGWLAAIYVLLIVPVSNIVTMFVLASWGFIDNWLRPSRPASL